MDGVTLLEYPRAAIARSIGNPVRVVSEVFVVPSSREDYYSESIVSHAVKEDEVLLSQ